MSAPDLLIPSLLFICAVLGWAGFNQPTWSRSCATALRYRAALAAHVALYVGAFVLLASVLRSALPPTDSNPDLRAWMGAFVFIACFRGIPPLARQIRGALHRIAGSPVSLARIADRMPPQALTLPPDIEREARALLANRNIEDGDWLPLASQAYRQLLNATALVLQLRRWETQWRYASFFGEARLDSERLHREFDRISFRFARALASVERLGILYEKTHTEMSDPAPVDDELRRIVRYVLADAHEDVSELYRSACRLAARAILSTSRTRRGRETAFARLGYTNLEPRPPSALRVLWEPALILTIGLSLFKAIPQPQTASNLSWVSLVTLIVLILLGSMAVAIVPKLRWGFANGGLHDRTPWAFVVSVGIVAVVLAVGINLAIGAIQGGGWPGAKKRLYFGSVYLHWALVTATVTAWLVQDHRWGQAPVRHQRVFDATILGVAWVAAWALSQWLKQVFGVGSAPQWNLLTGLARWLVLGLTIGYVTPFSVRLHAQVERRPLTAPLPAETPLSAQPA